MSKKRQAKTPPGTKRSGSETRQQNIVNTFRSTRADRGRADKAAADLGLTFGSFVRWKLFDEPETRPTRRPLPSEILLENLRAEAGHADGNLAQFLRKVNCGELVPSDQLDDAFTAVGDFYRKATALLFGEV
jgi:hypothetical protein